MPDPGTTPAFFAAPPTLYLDDELQSELADHLLTFLVEETAAGLYRCEASFSNWGSVDDGVDFLYFDRETLDFGAELVISAGAGQAGGQIFAGRITGLEGHFSANVPPEILILAEDRLQDLRMTRRTRSFENMTDEDIIGQIAAAHNLAADLDIDGPTYPTIAQLNQSDLAFLRDRAAAIDAELWVEDRTLYVHARSRREADEVSLTYQQGLISFSVLADLAQQRSGLTVSGWDVVRKEGLSHRATEQAIRAELNGFVGGGRILQDSLGVRDDAVVHHLPFSADEAQALAESYYRTGARRFVTGEGICQGDARLRVGSQVDLRGIGPLFNGLYAVTAVRHSFDGQDGFITRFTVERAGIGTS